MKKLIVISADALVYEDLELLKNTTTVGHMMKEGAVVKRLRSVYPTLTYPNHTTMLTGRYAGGHGIVHNTEYAPEKEHSDWLFRHDTVKCRDIFDAAKEAGLSTLSIGWPVTGNHRSIDYLLADIWPCEPSKKEDRQAFIDAFLDTGTPEWLLDTFVRKYLDLRVPIRYPESCRFNTHIFCDILREYSPDLCMLYTANIDAARHKYGVFNSEVERHVIMLDDFVKEVADTVKETGSPEETDFVITSDHGHIDVDRFICPNVLLQNAGLIETSGDGKVISWKAFSFGGGNHSQIMVNKELPEKEQAELKEIILRIFQTKKEEGNCGFEDIYTKEYTEKTEHLSGAFDFVLETDGHTAIISACDCEYMQAYEKPVGSHGHHPDKGPWATFIGYGPSFRTGACIDAANIVDTAPTYAKILGVDLPDTDGRALTEILQ